jgi:hypothetical protein
METEQTLEIVRGKPLDSGWIMFQDGLTTFQTSGDDANEHHKCTWSIGSLGDGAMPGDCDVAIEEGDWKGGT